MKKIFNFLFNPNTGTFVQPIFYTHNGNLQVGYCLCQGYRIFGISGYDVIVCCPDEISLQSTIDELKKVRTITL